MPDTRPRHVDVDQLSKDDIIPLSEANKHGYWGYSPETDREQYTVAGVTKDLDSTGQSKSADKPGDMKARADKNFAPLKGDKA